jgi:3(or 17)beta-hydroxysteroid dehydrogenase
MGRVGGKVCLVTGGGSGLGRADAVRLAEEGASVVVTDVDVSGGEETVRLAGSNAIFMEHDVVDEERWQKVIADTLSHFGKLNVLVNNAGIVIPGTIESITTPEWRRQQQIHMDGAFFGLKYGIGAIKQNDELGSIINMSSTTALQGFPTVFAYAAAKSAIRAMTKSAAVHCLNSGYKIRVNSLHPGVIDTPMVRNLGAAASATAAAAASDTPPPPPSPVGLGEPMDVANAVLFLASDESKFINGVELPIDNTATIQP